MYQELWRSSATVLAPIINSVLPVPFPVETTDHTAAQTGIHTRFLYDNRLSNNNFQSCVKLTFRRLQRIVPLRKLRGFVLAQGGTHTVHENFCPPRPEVCSRGVHGIGIQRSSKGANNVRSITCTTAVLVAVSRVPVYCTVYY